MCAAFAPKQDRVERGIAMSKNRAQRRAEKKQQPRWKKRFDSDERINAMCKNGITPKDVDNAYEMGRKEAIHQASEYIMKDCYAAFMLAAQEQFGFGSKRCLRLLRAADFHVINSLSSDEQIQEVFDRLGFMISFNDPQRITKTEATA